MKVLGYVRVSTEERGRVLQGTIHVKETLTDLDGELITGSPEVREGLMGAPPTSCATC